MIFETDLETGSAFTDGQEAARLGAGRSDCPYPESERGDESCDELRESWLAGFDVGPYGADESDDYSEESGLDCWLDA